MNQIEQLYEIYLRTRCVTTDSRRITPGCIFFALKGETFDGNLFARQALQDGASLCVVSDPQLEGVEGCMVVEDVLVVLQNLARYHRDSLSIPVVGITGTNGKTTTKELVNAVLSRRYRVHATQGNFNNHLGVPLTFLSMPANTEIAIIEMGANHPGEIAFLCNIARPTCGLITNVGTAHIEGFGSFEGVVNTKTELYRHLAATEGSVVFVNADNPILMERAAEMTSKSYGKAENAAVKGSCAGSNPYMRFYFEDGDNVYTVQTQLLGSYNFDNAMAAVAVGQHFGVDLFDIKEALEEYVPSNNRSQFKKTERNSLILDCYNANPSSMKAALDNFDQLKADNKMVILGSMKELGVDSEKEHRHIVERLKNSGYSRIMLVGPEFAQLVEGVGEISWFGDSAMLKESLQQNPVCGATILVKGSNSNKLWTLEELL